MHLETSNFTTLNNNSFSVFNNILKENTHTPRSRLFNKSESGEKKRNMLKTATTTSIRRKFREEKITTEIKKSFNSSRSLLLCFFFRSLSLANAFIKRSCETNKVGNSLPTPLHVCCMQL